MNHTVFNIKAKELLGMLDKAWKAKGAALPDDPGAYIIPMGRVVGTQGETAIKLVTKPNTSKVITAYPVMP